MTNHEKAQEAVFELLVDAFIQGFIEEAPEPEEFGLSCQRGEELTRKIAAA
jgi:hypothetical protein